jgi:hypothetical protein
VTAVGGPVPSDPAAPERPSPYVSLYMGRGRAEHALKALRWMAHGKTKSHPLWAVVRHFEQALGEETPDA